MQINTLTNRLLISLSLALPSYFLLYLIRGHDFSVLTVYGYGTYSVMVFLILIILFECHTKKSTYLNSYLSWQQRPIKRMLSESAFTLVLTPIVVSFFILVLYELIWNVTLLTDGMPHLIEYNLFALTFSFLMVAFVNADILILEWKRSLVYTEVMEKENMRAQLNALQSQVSPHFLFNNFNVLCALIDEDPKLARQYLESLSRIFRYVLHRKDKEVVSLKEELKFIEEYVFLLKIRFGDRLQYHLKADSENNYQIPPVTLQILVENAVKHNEISSQHPLNINIKLCDDAYLEVMNNLNLKQVSDESTGMGLKNIIERYSFLTDREIIINQKNKNFKVRVPLLEF